jgi:DNA-binding Xre family transcriptional regulator
MAKMTRGEPVAMTILVKICDELNCDVGDILSIKREKNAR